MDTKSTKEVYIELLTGVMGYIIALAHENLTESEFAEVLEFAQIKLEEYN